jgi:hypothetical protein
MHKKVKSPPSAIRQGPVNIRPLRSAKHLLNFHPPGTMELQPAFPGAPPIRG